MPMNYGKALLAAFLLLSLSLNSFAKGDPYAREMRSAATYSALTSANHPRLFADDEEFARIREAVLEGGNPMLNRLHERVMQIAETEGQSPDTLVAKLDASNMRLLTVCRVAAMRIFSAAYAYRFTGEERFLRHAEWDINTVCDFKSWNPTHFLDVGEMSTGVALGYDWLYAHLADSTKAKAVRAVDELSPRRATPATPGSTAPSTTGARSATAASSAPRWLCTRTSRKPRVRWSPRAWNPTARR